MPQLIRTRDSTRSRGPSLHVGPARRIVLLIAVLVTTALLVAACGGSSNNSSGSSGNSSGSADSSGSGASQSTADSSKAAKFSQCMRANGVPDFPDPNANGSITLKVTPGSDLDPNGSAYKGAIAKCQSLEPPGFGQSPGSTVSGQNKLLKFVSCMRSNGVPKFPDPGSQGQMVISSSSGIDPNSPAFQSAMQKCRSLLPNGGAGASAG